MKITCSKRAVKASVSDDRIYLNDLAEELEYLLMEEYGVHANVALRGSIIELKAQEGYPNAVFNEDDFSRLEGILEDDARNLAEEYYKVAYPEYQKVSSSSEADIADESDPADNEDYLQNLAIEIEAILRSEFNMECNVYADGAHIHIIPDIIDENEDVDDVLLSENDLATLTGILEDDAYGLAEEYYTNH